MLSQLPLLHSLLLPLLAGFCPNAPSKPHLLIPWSVMSQSLPRPEYSGGPSRSPEEELIFPLQVWPYLSVFLPLPALLARLQPPRGERGWPVPQTCPCARTPPQMSAWPPPSLPSSCERGKQALTSRSWPGTPSRASVFCQTIPRHVNLRQSRAVLAMNTDRATL